MSSSDQPDVSESTEQAATPDPTAGRRKVWLFSIAAVVVLLVAGVVVYLLTSGDDADNTAGTGVPTITGAEQPTASTTAPEPAAPGASTASATATAPPAADDPGQVQSVAEQAATAISSADVTTLAQLACDPATAGTEETFPANAKAEVAGPPQVDGDTATVLLRLTIGENPPTEVPMPMRKQDGRWCVP